MTKKLLSFVLIGTIGGIFGMGCKSLPLFDNSRYHYNGKIGNEHVRFYEGATPNINKNKSIHVVHFEGASILEVIKKDGTKIIYIDDNDDKKIDYLDIINNNNGKNVRYAYDHDSGFLEIERENEGRKIYQYKSYKNIGKQVFEKAQKQWENYLKIIKLRSIKRLKNETISDLENLGVIKQ